MCWKPPLAELVEPLEVIAKALETPLEIVVNAISVAFHDSRTGLLGSLQVSESAAFNRTRM